ncbi:MAG: glutamate--tRNA ligase [Alphaproteobacteria bacterium GM7ARS4]|nr:glutamate--tRNA ligase [Alphaproteobacteria bacterium GM7ARS4]
MTPPSPHRPHVRFAPSPTGFLHIGNARIALLNACYAIKHSGTLSLRIDDTDETRSQQRYTDALMEDLQWLGIQWHHIIHQSQRLDLYQSALQQLTQQGRLYPCYETQEELARKRSIALKQGRPPRYDRTALSLTQQQKQRYEQEGRQPYYRFLLQEQSIQWHDMVFGAHRHPIDNLSDPVVVRADKRPLFTLTSVIDDSALGITHILRGEDHMTNTAAQIALFKALGKTPPSFGHVPLLVNGQGKAFSKRDATDMSLRALKEQGLDPSSIRSVLAHLGSRKDLTPYHDMTTLAHKMDITSFSQNSPRLDSSLFYDMNRRLMRTTPFTNVKDHMATLPIPTKMAEDFWHVVRANVTTLNDLRLWADICFKPLAPSDILTTDDRNALQQIASLLPETPWDKATWNKHQWQQWCKMVAEKTGRKGKQLFLPLRLALTGQKTGPEIDALLPFIGKDETSRRLRQ